MAITGMMYTGLSGLTSTARSINVTGDNIANLNTVGYRGSRAMFEDVLSRSIPGVGELGGGTTVAQIEKLFHQGPIVSSPKPEDIAISGRGFFVVAGLNDGVDGTFYTRAGNFNIDNQGYLSTNGGLRVQGYAPTDGIAGSRLQDVRLERSIEPSATTRMQMTVNFDGQTMTTTPVPFDPANPGQTSAFSQDTIVYDSRGTAHEVTAYFTRTGQDTWCLEKRPKFARDSRDRKERASSS
ncbi:MAG: flagellar hook-basal body complex protein, partial [Myxococcota bacterium]